MRKKQPMLEAAEIQTPVLVQKVKTAKVVGQKMTPEQAKEWLEQFPSK